MGTAGEVAAVVGIGQTKHMATRGDVSMAGLVREAALRALADADMSWDDIDAVVVGKAPDFFEGVMMPELYLADALGAVGKPLLRVHTAGSVGGSTAIVASSLVNVRRPRARAHRGVREAVRVRGDVGAVAPHPVPGPAGGWRRWLLRPPHPGLHAPVERPRPHRHPGGPEGPAQRLQEPVRPPPRARHHVRVGEGLDDAVGPDPLQRDLPQLRRRLRHGDRQRRHRQGGRPTRHGSTAPPCARSRRCSPAATRCCPQGGRDCAADVYAQAGITNPRAEIDVVEMYVPFSWYEPMWLENLGFAGEGEGWQLTDARRHRDDRRPAR